MSDWAQGYWLRDVLLIFILLPIIAAYGTVVYFAVVHRSFVMIALPVIAIPFALAALLIFVKRVVAISTKDPGVSGGVHPSHAILSCSGTIIGRGCALCSVNTSLVPHVWTSNPCPLATAVLPEVIDHDACSGRIIANSSEEPEIPEASIQL
jgi:hypothetical protein